MNDRSASSVSSAVELEFFQALVNSAEVGICVTDIDHRFVFVNPAYCRTYGYARDELIGEPFTKMLPPEERARAARLHDDFLDGGDESAGEWEVVDKARQLHKVLVTAGQVNLDDGRRFKVTTVSDITKVREQEDELRYLSKVIEQTTHGVILTDADGRVTWVNPATKTMTGFTLEEMRGQKPGDLFQGPDTDPSAVHYMAEQLKKREGFQVELVNYTKSGKKYDVHISCSPILDRAGAVSGFMALQTDVSDRNLSKKRLEEAEFEAKKLFVAIHQSPASIVITDCDGNIDFVNETCVKNSGYERRELVGQNPRVLQSGKTDKALYADLWGTITRGQAWQGRLINRRKDGSEFVEWATVSPVVDESGDPMCFIAVKEDITEREQLAQRLESIERYDTLTGLPNRAAFFEALEARLQEDDQLSARQPLALINIDRFRSINSLHGHEHGDRLLWEVGQKLQRQLPSEWFTARVGPDEFAVLPELQTSVSSQSASSDSKAPDDDLEWIQKIQRALREVAAPEGAFSQTSSSVGIAYSEAHTSSAQKTYPGDLMQWAELAMRSAKNQGGGRIGFFDAESSLQAQDALQLEHDLRNALDRQELYVTLQAQLNLEGRLVGAEALLRWKHAKRGEISPGVFIPLAEDSGQINAIGHWVLQQALQILARIQAFAPELTMSVNVSPIQIRRKKFVDDVRDLIEQSGANPTGLILEMTESVFMKDPELAAERLRSLRDLGIQISIDDFGTGFSSLTYLKRLPVNELKIDKSFVSDLPDDAADVALVNIILSAAHQFQLRVVAEGVETQAQVDFFSKAPDAVLQGFHFDRPTATEEWFATWLPANS